MLSTILYCLFLLLLTWLLVDDFKYRAVRWWLFPLLIALAPAIEYYNLKFKDIVFNGCFVLIQLAMLSIYFSIKERKFTNITHRYLGWGDILFWIILCLLLSPLNFVLFFLFSMIIVTFVFSLWKFFNVQPDQPTIPLAGIQAMALLIVWAIVFFSDKISFREDQWIEQYLTI
ncbi:MAG TPA: hypothetical protein VNB90_03295 [Cytophagaceae bacterium]|nr:hypothetical protein [Cytophagaceae bacterium]